jgi:hypothetical protein
MLCEKQRGQRRNRYLCREAFLNYGKAIRDSPAAIADVR